MMENQTIKVMRYELASLYLQNEENEQYIAALKEENYLLSLEVQKYKVQIRNEHIPLTLPKVSADKISNLKTDNY